jgi:GT2 family glycosyltransferase
MTNKVCVIVLNYNQNKYSIDCINSLIASSYSNYVIILIDNGSTKENFIEYKDQVDQLNNSKIKLFRIEKNIGYVGGINYGLNVCQSENPHYILIMNNDTLMDGKSIEELVKVCKIYDNRVIVSGKVYHYNEPNKIQYIGANLSNKKILEYSLLGTDEVDKGQYDLISERDMLDDVYWLFPNELLKEIGYYSPYFWFNAEQMDFALRAKKAGYKLIFTPNAKLWHKGSITFGGRGYNPKLAYYNTRNSLIVRYIHLNKKYFIIFYLKTLISVFRTFIKAVSHLIFKKPSILKYSFAKFLGLHSFNCWFFTKKHSTGYNPF